MTPQIMNGMRWTTTLGLVLILVHHTAAAAMAVHQASDPKPEKPVFQWIFALVMAGLIAAVAFKNPKRSHQS